MLDVLFLGTGASLPSRDRALPGVAVRNGPDIVLFDCGEGTQRQIMVSPFSFMKLRAVFVTHMHGDHFYGLPGLLQTMGMMNRREPLTVCGPEGFSAALGTALGLCEGEIPYELDVRDVSPGDVVRAGRMGVSVFATDHGIRSQGYVLREPDSTGRVDPNKMRALGLPSEDVRRVVGGEAVGGVSYADIAAPDRRGTSLAYTGDTRPCATLDEAVAGADAIVHESTYSADDADLAGRYLHSTCADAAAAAARAGAKALFLVHVSNRYKDRRRLLEQARAVFPETYMPEDLALYHVTRKGVR